MMDNQMPDISVTSDLLARCLGLLKIAEGPAPAAEIAEDLHLGGNRETRRRHVRAIIAELRRHDHWIIAINPDGYWWTEDAAIWKDYLDGRFIDGRQIIGEASSRRRAVTRDASGQGFLFSPNKV